MIYLLSLTISLLVACVAYIFLCHKVISVNEDSLRFCNKEIEKLLKDSIASIEVIKEYTNADKPMAPPLALAINAICNREISKLNETLDKHLN